MGSIAEFDPVYTVVNQAKGWYPIHLACQYSQTRLIRLLLHQPSINIEHPDGGGCTALHHACMSNDPRALEVVQMLVSEFGANVLAKNGQGQAPYDLATSNNVRQFLLPIQLQKETQIALDNGGQGLPPGIDLGGLRIKKSNIAPPPRTFGSPPAARTQSTGMYPPTPIPTDPSKIAAAPATMPPNLAMESTPAAERGYSLRGSSSAAIFSSKYTADGFHSSSSDINLQQKYGHDTSARQYVTAPPPSSGNASMASVGAPLSGNVGVGGDGTNNPFSRGSALVKQRYVTYGPAEPAPVAPVASQPAYNQYAPEAPAASNFSTFAPGATAMSPQPAAPATPAHPTQSNSSTPRTPFMPPPPYQTQNYEAPSKRSDFVSPTTATYGGSPMTPAAPGMPAREQSSQDLFSAPQPPVPSPSAPISGTSGGSAQELFSSPQPPVPTPSAPISGTSVGSAQELFSAPQPSPTAPSTFPAPVSGTSVDSAQELFADPDAAASSEAAAQSDSIFTPPEQKDAKDPVPASRLDEAAPPTDSAEAKKPTNGTSDAPNDDLSPGISAMNEDWVETTDPSTGQTYYYNKATNETSWEDPKGSAMVAEIGSTASDWIETPDPTTGKTYYYNSVTQETSWEKPDGVKSEEEAASGWAEVVDPSSGQTYYYNQNTQETAWEKPVALTKSSDDSHAGSDWSKTIDPTSGQTYYYNHVTQETSWEKPESLQESQQDESTLMESKDESKEPNATNDSNMSSDWIETVDPSSGQRYYYNLATQETSWEKPPNLVDTVNSVGEASQSADAFQPNSADTPISVQKSLEPAVPAVPVAESMTRRISAQELFGEGPPAQEEVSDDKKQPGGVGAAVTAALGSGEKPLDDLAEVTESSEAAQGTSDEFPSAGLVTAEHVAAPSGDEAQSTEEEQKPVDGPDQPVIDDVDGTEVGEMLDIPLSPEPMHPTRSQPEAQPEPSADLFAAIGMPPPPFQSKR